MPKIVALTRSLTDAGEDGKSAVVERDVINELHDDDCLADTGAPEEADLPTFRVGFQQVHHLDPGLQHFGLRFLFVKRRSQPMNGVCFLGLDRPEVIHRLTQHVD